MLSNLRILLDHDQRLTLTRTEDRSVRLQVQDAQEQAPFDLTNYSLTFAFPKDGGGSVKLRTGLLDLSTAPVQVLDGDTFFYLADHGLVDGQVVTLQSTSDNDSLPLPFSPNTPYRVFLRSRDEFALRGLGGQRMAVGSPSMVAAALSSADMDVPKPTLGEARITLSAKQTQAAALGQGQSYQLTFVDQAGLRHILGGAAQLDVFEQPCP